MSPKRFLYFFGVVPILALVSYAFYQGNQKTPAEKVVAAAEAANVEKMRGELETVNKGDILETHWEGDLEGSYQLLVVVNPLSGDGKRDSIHYQTLGAHVTQNMPVQGLVHRVVRVYRIDTPEWKEKAQQFVRQR